MYKNNDRQARIQKQAKRPFKSQTEYNRQGKNTETRKMNPNVL